MKFLILSVFFCYSQFSMGLIPLESLLLGDDTKNRITPDDPLIHIFGKYESSKSYNEPKDDPLFSSKKKLGVYRGFLNEALNLDNYCSQRPKIEYSRPFLLDQAKKGVMGTLQYIGLDIIFRSLPRYAKFFNFSRSDYQNLGKNLIGNYCSANMSIISIRQLKKNYIKLFDDNNYIEFPSIKGNSLFPLELSELNQIDEIKRREMKMNIELFKAFCSWSTDANNPRLLVPLLQNSVVMSFIHRQMSKKRVVWDFLKNEVFLEENSNTLQVACEGLICRRVTSEQFDIIFPQSIGHTSIINDLNRLYCQEFRDLQYQYKNQPTKISEMMKSKGLEEDILLSSYFISLITSIPDFMLYSNSYKDVQTVLKSSFEREWNKWSNEQIARHSGDLYYEESLQVNLIDRSYFYDAWTENFKVELDINLGEFDKSISLLGKLKTKFDVKISNRFLRWSRKHWKNVDLKDPSSMEKVLKPFRLVVKDTFSKIHNKFLIPPWKGDLEKIYMIEVMEQITRHKGKYFEKREGMTNIPVYLNYGSFALRYIRDKYLSVKKKNQVDNLAVEEINTTFSK